MVLYVVVVLAEATPTTQVVDKGDVRAVCRRSGKQYQITEDRAQPTSGLERKQGLSTWCSQTQAIATVSGNVIDRCSFLLGLVKFTRKT